MCTVFFSHSSIALRDSGLGNRDVNHVSIQPLQEPDKYQKPALRKAKHTSILHLLIVFFFPFEERSIRQRQAQYLHSRNVATRIPNDGKGWARSRIAEG